MSFSLSSSESANRSNSEPRPLAAPAIPVFEVSALTGATSSIDHPDVPMGVVEVQDGIDLGNQQGATATGVFATSTVSRGRRPHRSVSDSRSPTTGVPPIKKVTSKAKSSPRDDPLLEVQELRRRLHLAESQSTHFVDHARKQNVKVTEANDAAQTAEAAAKHYASEAFTHHQQAEARSEQTVKVGQEAFRRIQEADAQVTDLRAHLDMQPWTLIEFQQRSSAHTAEKKNAENHYINLQKHAATQSVQLNKYESETE